MLANSLLMMGRSRLLNIPPACAEHEGERTIIQLIPTILRAKYHGMVHKQFHDERQNMDVNDRELDRTSKEVNA